jgi:hypothetical protein
METMQAGHQMRADRQGMGSGGWSDYLQNQLHPGMGDWGKQKQMRTDCDWIGSTCRIPTHRTVFSEAAAKHFPPAEPEDHMIKLKPDAPQTINCKVYPLTHAEQEATTKFLRENEALKYIEKMDSPWSTPWFFIKKKDGSLRLI